jgi:hypothetical protein
MIKYFLPIFIISLACARQDNESKVRKIRNTQSPDINNDQKVNPDGSDKVQNTDSLEIEVSESGAKIQLKDPLLLASSISTCVGEEMTLVKESMIIRNTESKGFLSPEVYQVNSDAILVGKKDLFGSDTGSRLSARSDGLSITYLGAINIIADIVADNCTADNPLCRCSTQEEAKNMMVRCLPAISPANLLFDEVTEEFRKVCELDQQKAIASLLASYAFIISR